MTHEKHCPLSLAYDEVGLGAEKCQGCKVIRAAVAEERERCAKIVEAGMSWGHGSAGWSVMPMIAAAIREQQLGRAWEDEIRELEGQEQQP